MNQMTTAHIGGLRWLLRDISHRLMLCHDWCSMMIMSINTTDRHYRMLRMNHSLMMYGSSCNYMMIQCLVITIVVVVATAAETVSDDLIDTQSLNISRLFLLLLLLIFIVLPVVVVVVIVAVVELVTATIFFLRKENRKKIRNKVRNFVK